MIPSARDHLSERLCAALGGLRREMVRGVPRRYLVPDEHARLVRRFEVFGRADLDVAAQKVQAEALALRYLLAHVLLRRRRVDRFGVKILVECRAHVERLAVQIELAVARLKRAEAEAFGDSIVVVKPYLHGIERRT